MSKQKQEKSMLVLAIFMAFIVMVFVPGLIRAGDLEPSAPPGPTMKTLDEIPPTWSQKIDDATERFELVLPVLEFNGIHWVNVYYAVLDKETGLVWAKNANIASGPQPWEDAVIYCRNLVIGNRKGWRLPNVEELGSLVDPSELNPALPSGYSSFFDNVQSFYYWSSTTHESNVNFAWYVGMSDGHVYKRIKSNSNYMWPVRGGSGPILVPHTP